MIRCVIYVRTSTADQESGLETQIDDVSAKIYQVGDREIVKIIRDEDTPGDSDPEYREGFLEVLRMVNNDEIDELWSQSRDRLSRDVDILGYIRILLKKKEVPIVCLDDEDNKAIARVKDLFGEMELEKYREKRYKGMLRRINSKKVMSRPPFGYAVDEEGSLIIDDSKRGLIRRLFGEFDNPFSSLKTLSMKYNIPVSTLRNIRSNPIYRTGEVRWAGKIAYYVEAVVPEDKDQMLKTDWEGS
ncbi:MAG: recombinase family protein [Candidatus Heimdallarchaeota archaeon]|nr:recombinase family protein [Candidatus Heimdallarchaeota archaeon]